MFIVIPIKVNEETGLEFAERVNNMVKLNSKSCYSMQGAIPLHHLHSQLILLQQPGLPAAWFSL